MNADNTHDTGTTELVCMSDKLWVRASDATLSECYGSLTSSLRASAEEACTQTSTAPKMQWLLLEGQSIRAAILLRIPIARLVSGPVKAL